MSICRSVTLAMKYAARLRMPEPGLLAVKMRVWFETAVKRELLNLIQDGTDVLDELYTVELLSPPTVMTRLQSGQSTLYIEKLRMYWAPTAMFWTCVDAVVGGLGGYE